MPRSTPFRDSFRRSESGERKVKQRIEAAERFLGARDLLQRELPTLILEAFDPFGPRIRLALA
jgi:hypothetical protein